jgi:protein arginine N-methyltransferase 1
MYSIGDYGDMIADHLRMDPYVYALKAAIEPGSVVLDIGTGTGMHALLACKFGARKVYAIETNDAIHLARELAVENGFADRIEFIQAISTQVTLPEKADVIVSDLRGVLPLHGQHISHIIDARSRFLAPGGVMIPRRDTILVALVEAGAVYRDLTAPWNYPYGISMTAAEKVVLNDWSDESPETFRKKSLLIEPQVWSEIDYWTIESPEVNPANIIQPATRSGTAHGFLMWFDGEIAEGILVSNHPGEEKVPKVYGCGFFPLFEPVAIHEGDTIEIDIQARYSRGHYLWNWHTKIFSGDERQEIKADFQQSTGLNETMENAALDSRVLALKPSRSETGDVDYLILGAMDGDQTLEQIANRLYKKFPTRFKTKREAQRYVNALSQDYHE